MQPGDATKWCSGCKTEKSPDEFHRNKSRPDGLQNRCKVCSYSSHRKSLEKNKDQRKKDAARRKLDKYLQAQFGMNIDNYDLLLWDQNGKCSICHDEMKVPRVDFDPEREYVRSLLCGTCLTGILSFEQSTEKLLRAISYLDSYKTPNGAL